MLTLVSSRTIGGVAMALKTSRQQISVRVDDELLNEVERAAQEERRTVSNLVRNVLADWASERRVQHEAAA
jgi:metal-responsive CopG/Arc/MetJ family transcriptional regulator